MSIEDSDDENTSSRAKIEAAFSTLMLNSQNLTGPLEHQKITVLHDAIGDLLAAARLRGEEQGALIFTVEGALNEYRERSHENHAEDVVRCLRAFGVGMRDSTVIIDDNVFDADAAAYLYLLATRELQSGGYEISSVPERHRIGRLLY